MESVGKSCQTLFAPVRLQEALTDIGKREHFGSQSVLFYAGDPNAGVYLVGSGEVRLEVPGMPRLTRVFSSGSLLGLPSTFSEKPYGLTAVSSTESEIVHVSNKKFLDLMKAQPELCREATDILTREIAFIFAALPNKRSHRPARRNPPAPDGVSPSRPWASSSLGYSSRAPAKSPGQRFACQPPTFTARLLQRFLGLTSCTTPC